MTTFSGQLALVTGGTCGQELTHALDFARHGVHVTLLDLTVPVSAPSLEVSLSQVKTSANKTAAMDLPSDGVLFVSSNALHDTGGVSAPDAA